MSQAEIAALIAQALEAQKRGDQKAVTALAMRAAELSIGAPPPVLPANSTDMDRIVQFVAVMGQALEARRRGDERTALILFARALETQRDLGVRVRTLEASEMVAQGMKAQAAGDHSTAVAKFQQALAADRADGRAPDSFTAGILSQLGTALTRTGQWRAARDMLAQGLALVDDGALAAPILTGLSAANEKLGDYEAAKDYAERDIANRRAQNSGVSAELAVSLNNAGVAALGLEDFAYGVSRFREALAMARATGADAVWIAAVADNLGLALARMGDHANAAPLHEEALAIRRAKLGGGHPDTARSLMHLGSLALQSGDEVRAAELYGAALSVFENHHEAESLSAANCLGNLAILAARKRELEAARLYLMAALGRLRPVFGEDYPLLMRYEMELAYVTLFRGDLGEAMTLAYAVLRRAQAPEQDELRRDLWYLLSLLAAARGALGSAILFGKLAINVVQRQRGSLRALERPLQRLFAARHGDMFRHLALQMVKTGRIAEASRVLGMLKEDELFELLRRDPDLDPRLTFAALTALEAVWQSEGDEIIDVLAEIAAETAALRYDEAAAGRLAALAERRDGLAVRFEAWLNRAEATVAMQAAAAPVDMAWFRPGLGAALLQILPGSDRLHLLLTTSNFQIGREVALSEPVLNRLVHEFRVAIEQRDAGALGLGRVLYGHLIAPVAMACREAGIETLLIAPAGALRYLPFAALHDGERYLAETMPVVLFTEAAPDGDGAAPLAPRVAGFGVTRALPGFRALPAVADELSRIVEDFSRSCGIFPGEICLDEAFTAARLSDHLATHQMVHIASHFVFEPEAAKGSFLLLGDGSHLRLADMNASSFRFTDIDLVALSACETALGEAAGDGSEVEGFGAMVRRRGARQVLATLWPVEDSSTPTFMEEFYLGRRDGAKAALALARAQRNMLHGNNTAFRHPYHWAPFILMAGAQ